MEHLKLLEDWTKENVRNPKETARPDELDCELLHKDGQWHPHTACLSENGDCVRAFCGIAQGFAGVIAPYDWAAHWEREFNSKKSRLKNEASLSNQSYDALTDEQKTELQDYCAALDALAFSGDTEFTAWPAKPEFI